MKLKIITPKQLVLDAEVTQVTLPGAEGEMTILPGHTFLMAKLKKGILRAPNHSLEISGGLVEVSLDHITVLTA